MKVDFYSTTFCEPCMVTRTVLADAARLVPGMTLAEHDVVLHEAEAEARGVRSAPTVIVSDGNGGEVFRAEGIPTLNQVLVALAKAV